MPTLRNPVSVAPGARWLVHNPQTRRGSARMCLVKTPKIKDDGTKNKPLPILRNPLLDGLVGSIQSIRMGRGALRIDRITDPAVGVGGGSSSGGGSGGGGGGAFGGGSGVSGSSGSSSSPSRGIRSPYMASKV